jgi:REP element-mobilizing transposase RayT
MQKEIRPGREVVIDIRNREVEIVLLTKIREPSLTVEHVDMLKGNFAKVAGLAGCELMSSFVSASGVVRLKVRVPDDVNLSELVKSLKVASSRVLANRFGRDPEIFTELDKTGQRPIAPRPRPRLPKILLPEGVNRQPSAPHILGMVLALASSIRGPSFCSRPPRRCIVWGAFFFKPSAK